MFLRAAYHLTIQDFEEAQIQHRGWTGRFLQLVGVVIMLSALPSLLTHEYFQGFLGLLLGGFVAFGTRILLRRAFMKEPSLQLETKNIISEDGLVLTTSRAETKLNWSAFIRYTETKDIFVLYVQSRMFHIIPKRAFRAEDVITLREMFSSHISAPSPSAGRPSTQALLFAFVVVTAIVLVYFAIHANRQ